MFHKRNPKMLFSGYIYALFLVTSHVMCKEQSNEVMEMIPSDISTENYENEFTEKNVERFLEVAALAEKYRRRDTTHYGVDGEYYEEMNDILKDITNMVRNNYNNTNKLLKSKGIDKVFLNNLKINNDEHKVHLLLLLKALFDTDPVSSTAFIPISVVDRLLHIFEHDNLALKAHALDVLYLWLPNNPKVQSRVMKLKGLQPFYEQITKLDTNVIKMLLDLFNIILKEHILVRGEDSTVVVDPEKLKFYQRTGLLEHMSTPRVCNGLLNIFTTAWSYDTKDNNILMTVFDLLKNIKQYCVELFRGKIKAKKLFMALQDYIHKPENKEIFVLHGLNITEINKLVKEYTEKFDHQVKDEF